jgi:cytochrome c oxidase cbb3-type subunit III
MSDKDRLIDHNYDGIQEYDNPLPRWWVILFWATIIFSVLYWFNLGTGIGPGRIAQYDAEVAAAKAAAPPPPEATSPEALAAMVSNAEVLASAKQAFVTNCASCHKADGGGMIGPNLTDNAWIHGGSLVEIRKTITEGVIAKGMPPWGTLLKPDVIDGLTAYVASLKGTNPPGAKAAEGTVLP